MDAIVTERAKLYPGVAGVGMEPTHSMNLNPLVFVGTPSWLVASTRSRHEKSVLEQLQRRSIDCYLPLSEKLNQWHDRKKRVVTPAFPGYIFVRIPAADRVRVLEVPGVSRFVGFGSGPAAIPDDEIESLRVALTSRSSEPHPYLGVGTRVEIAAGPLRGLKGVVERGGRGLRLIVSVDFVCRSVAVELHESDLAIAA